MSDNVDQNVYYAVGDVHGCYDLLNDLLAQIVDDLKSLGEDRFATVIFLGDYVDRGPDSSKTVSSLIWLARTAGFPWLLRCAATASVSTPALTRLEF